MYDPYAGFKRATLENGISLYSSKIDRPWVIVEFVIHSGAREDTPGRAGIAHFVEHLVSENVSGISRDGISKLFEKFGGRARLGSTSSFATRYRFFVPAHDETFLTALNIFQKMLLTAHLENGIENERKVIEQEFNNRYPIRERMKWETAYRKELFRGHWLENFVRPLGYPDGFMKVTGDELQAFYDVHYTPANMSIVVLSPFDDNKLIGLFNKSLFSYIMKPGSRVPVADPKLIMLELPKEHLLDVKLSDHTTLTLEQIEYCVRWAFPATVKPRAAGVFASVLNDTLFEEFRTKRGLTYGVNASVQKIQDVYEFTVSGRIAKDAGDSIDALVEECIGIASRDVAGFEHERSRRIAKLGMLDLSGHDIVGNVAGDLESDQHLETLQEEQAYLEALTEGDMHSIAGLLVPERQFVFKIRP